MAPNMNEEKKSNSVVKKHREGTVTAAIEKVNFRKDSSIQWQGTVYQDIVFQCVQ